jgi:hypothetical protein
VSYSPLSDGLITAMLTTSITGAGLTIAFYALLANMSEKVFTHRFEKLTQYKNEIKKISSDPESFNDENLKTTNEILERMRKKADAMKTFPRYLGFGIGLNFAIFISSAFCCLNLLVMDPTARADADMLQSMALILYNLSIALFAIVGIYGLSDIGSTLWSNFNKIAKGKEEVKLEISYAPKEAEIFKEIRKALSKKSDRLTEQPMIKVEGKILRPDLIIKSQTKGVFIIEIVSKPTADSVYHLSEGYEPLKQQTNAKTILIANFENRSSIQNIAKSFWDYTLDLKEIDKLSSIID